MNRPEYIVWHTAADSRDSGRRDTSANEIDAWHRQRGWDGIGYHFVVRRNGTIELGRPLWATGAHVKGLNTRSVGICFSGHGDLEPFSGKQITAGRRLTVALCIALGLSADRVVGHRETREIPGVTTGIKSCPGNLVSMENARVLVRCSLEKLLCVG